MLERSRSYASESIWDCDAGEGGTARKCASSYASDSIWDYDAGEGIAATKCVISYASNSIWDCDAGEGIAAIECVRFYASYSAANFHLLQHITIHSTRSISSAHNAVRG